MPSHTQESSHASASSSKHGDYGPSPSRTSRYDRHSDGAHRRPRSPDEKYYDHRVDSDRHRQNGRGREDDHRPSHRSSYGSQYADAREYQRNRRSDWSPPHRDSHHSAYDSRDSSSNRIRYRSPESWRHRSPDPNPGWVAARRDDEHSDFDLGRGKRSKDDRIGGRPSISDHVYKGSDWRGDRSPDRSRSSYRSRETGRARQNGDYGAVRHRDEYRGTSRNSRSRSRSRERSRTADVREDRRSATEGRHSQATKRDERSECINGSRDDTKLLKRKDNSETSAPNSTRSLHSKPKDDTTVRHPESRRDAEYDRLERLASAPDTNRDKVTIAGESRHGLVVDSDSAAHLPSKLKSQPSEHPRSDRPYDLSNGRRRSCSILAKVSASRSHSSSSEAPISHGVKIAAKSATTDPAPRPAPKEEISKRSFGHVLLPHELSAELRGSNNMATATYKEGATIVLMSAAEKQSADVKPVDPRRSIKKTHFYRELLYPAKFTWDANSVGRKPLPAPRNVVLTNLSALIQPSQLLMHVRRFGRVESSKLEMDPKIGQSLGIFCVTFAHDYDEQGKPLHSIASDQTPQNGAKAARVAQLALDGLMIGQSRIIALLDRSGEVVAEKVKEKVAAAEAKLRRPPPAAPAVLVSGSPVTPSATKPNMPPPNIPRGPRASATATSSPLVLSSSPSVRPNMDRLDHPSSRFAWHATISEHSRKPSSLDSHHRRRDMDEYDSLRSRSYGGRRLETSERSPSPSRVEAPKKVYHKIPTDEIVNTLRKSGRPYVFIPKPKLCDIETAVIEAHLESTPPVWIREGDTGWYAAYGETRDANACKVVNETLTIGGFTLQVDVRPPLSKSARPVESKQNLSSRALLPSTSGARTIAPAVQPRKTLDTGLRPLTAEEKQKSDWIAAELQEAVFRMLQNELADTFVRDVKSRLVAPHLNTYLKSDNEGGQILAKAVIKKSAIPSKTIDRGPMSFQVEMEPRLPSFRKVVAAEPKKMVADGDAIFSKAKRETLRAHKERDTPRKSKSQRTKNVSSSDDESEDTELDIAVAAARRSGNRTKSKSATKKRGAAPYLLVSEEEEAESDDATTTEPEVTSRSVSASVEPIVAEYIAEDATSKGKKKPKAKVGSAISKKGAVATKKGAKNAMKLDGEAEETEETLMPEVDLAAKVAKSKAKSTKAAGKARPIPADPFEAGLAEDAEDCYYLRLAIEHLRKTGELPNEDTWPDELELEAEAEERAVAAGSLPKHSTGSARTEGFYRIPPEQKAMHLPDRNKATDDAEASNNAQVLQSARNNRADSRRLVLGIEQHKRETATDTDIFKFNQLRTRKKQLKFAKSPIHDWGLYAMEYIPAGDMVIEYVGEVVRQQVADEREKQYERQGNFSTYLFRVDDDLVVDATHKGNIARLMNHCCTPNCNAKILTLNGEKRIVLFAKTAIRAGEELTYDYKFQSSADDEDAIPCLCGSSGCRRFL